MSTKYFDYRAGVGNVGSYQASGKPFLSSSIDVPSTGEVIKISFPNVTRFITVKNIGPDDGSADMEMRVGFSENGVNGVENNNWLVLANQESYSADWRISAVYLRVETSASFNVTASVIAGLTTIDSADLRSNWSGSLGVG
tara:strand:- start:874 stop:1296 length:423 start_codon:yes stop_codon:yes gene_type:complete